MPRPKREVTKAPPRVGRVNQKMIDQMIRMRTEGITHAEIARRLGRRKHERGGKPSQQRTVHVPSRVVVQSAGSESSSPRRRQR